VSEKVGCTAFAVVLCGAAVYFLVYASGRLVGFAEALIGRIPEFTSRVSEIVSKLGDRFPLFAGSEVLPILPGLFSEAASYVAGAIAEALGAIVQGLPESIAGVVFGVVAFVYLMADMPGAAAGVRAILPKEWERGAVRALSGAQSALLSYLRSCLVLMAVTFTCLLVGLWALGVASPFALSLVIAFVDALPVFGCGTVLVPWAVWSFAVGRIGRGAGLLILFLVTYLIRQFLEPRLIGRMTGAHPFVALAAVYVGWRLAGVLGLVLAPVALVFVRWRRTVSAPKIGTSEAEK
jgi:sporulation integral membrane protein YtvI